MTSEQIECPRCKYTRPATREEFDEHNETCDACGFRFEVDYTLQAGFIATCYTHSFDGGKCKRCGVKKLGAKF